MKKTILWSLAAALLAVGVYAKVVKAGSSCCVPGAACCETAEPCCK